MKKYYTLLFLAIGFYMFQSCSSHSVTLNTMRPAEITFPSHVKKLLVVDRTEFDKKAVNIIEGLLTGEMPGEDRAGAQAAINAFQSGIRRSPRFEIIKASERLKGNSITAAFPNALPWSTIEDMCSRYSCDAVVAVEIFDTDFVVTDGSRRVKKTFTENGKKVEREVTEYFAQGVANVQIGFRLYDPKMKTIADEQLFTESSSWEGVGNSARDALSHLIAKSEATRAVSEMAGNAYAFKVAPMPITLTRKFYSKSKKIPQLGKGSRKSEVGDWHGAIEAWKNGLESTAKPKHAGKLSFNIAVAYEVLGDLEMAKEWASKSYVDYGNKDARNYISKLENRMNSEARVREQMQ